MAIGQHVETEALARGPWTGIRFDRNELAGAFGDIGTDLPLILAIILATGMDGASALIMFGLLQIMTGLMYRMPMPVQPLKAMATLVIASAQSPHPITAEALLGAGLAIGVVMFLLSATGLIEWLARAIPKTVVRGIQLGLGLMLADIALRQFVPADGTSGYILAGLAFVIALTLLGNRRVPPALLIIALGIAYAVAFKIDPVSIARGVGLRLPQLHLPTWNDVLAGFVLLALPQIPLSLGNSILATRQVAEDLFPERPLTVRRIGLTYALMNLVNPFFGGIPTCHGSGGMAGHYAFGGRTGGSVIIYGSFYIVLGAFFSGSFAQVVEVFPKPILGIVLLFEALTLMLLVRDAAVARKPFMIVLLVGVLAAGLPRGYGYLAGMILGTVLYYATRTRTGSADSMSDESSDRSQ
ncbi:MAG TPA: solute carrier family 23 protein [Phycisphaerae bacterium]